MALPVNTNNTKHYDSFERSPSPALIQTIDVDKWCLLTPCNHHCTITKKDGTSEEAILDQAVLLKYSETIPNAMSFKYEGTREHINQPLIPHFSDAAEYQEKAKCRRIMLLGCCITTLAATVTLVTQAILKKI